MMIAAAAHLYELNSSPIMIDNFLITIRCPPFNGDIVFTSSSDDPKRNSLSSHFMDLGIPGLLLRRKMNVAFEQSGLDPKPEFSVKELDEPMNRVIRSFIAEID